MITKMQHQILKMYNKVCAMDTQVNFKILINSEAYGNVCSLVVVIWNYVYLSIAIHQRKLRT